jgi:DNA helicase-2/ATP-dependent DNA helicase PcrA
VIDKNQSSFPRELKTYIETGLPIEIIPCRSERHEAEIIVRKIESLLGGYSYFAIDSGRAARGMENTIYSLKDIAILYRFHAQSKIIKNALEKAGLPYETFGKDAQEISTEEEFKDFVTNDKSVPPSIEYRGEKISLLTLHRAKGLEFPVVFITGLEEGVLPYLGPGALLVTTSGAIRRQPVGNGAISAIGETHSYPSGVPNKGLDVENTGMEEERRLFYVGITRAKNNLILCHSAKRFLFGKNLATGPSRFLKDIHETLKIFQNTKIPLKKKKPIQQNLFEL